MSNAGNGSTSTQTSAFLTAAMQEEVRKILSPEEPKQSKTLQHIGAYTVSSLTDEDKVPPHFFVQGMIPAGLSAIIGPPKSRKSFLALQMGIAISTGQPFLGMKTDKASVLYLDLEGSHSRTASRTSKMDAVPPDNLLISHYGKLNIADGSLLKAIQEVNHERPDIKVVIIDTFGRAKGKYSAGGMNSYEADTQLLMPLQQAAQELKIAIIVIHHAKKGAVLADDIFERASGSMALTGLCDSVINLSIDGKERSDGVAKLDIAPRDAECATLNIEFDNRTCEWSVVNRNNYDLTGMPVPAFIIQHCPPKGNAPAFFSYGDVYTQAYHYHTAPADAGEKIRNIITENRNRLIDEHGIAVQVGARSPTSRGIRIMQI